MIIKKRNIQINAYGIVHYFDLIELSKSMIRIIQKSETISMKIRNGKDRDIVTTTSHKSLTYNKKIV